MPKETKTNVIRILESKKISYRHYEYDNSLLSGAMVAAKLNQDTARLFKTLVTTSKSKEHYVFMIPADEELDLKKAAKSVGEKSIEMLPQKDLLPLTGYVHGGCSPIGMKKQFITTLHNTAQSFETIFFSAGKVGFQVEVAPSDLEKIISLHYADVIKCR